MKVKEIMRKATAFLLLTSMNLGSIGVNTIYAADMTGDGTNVATQVVPEPFKQGTLAVKVNSIGGTVEINTDGTNDTQIIRKEADKTTLTDAAGNVTEAVVTDEGYALVLEADEGTVVHTKVTGDSGYDIATYRITTDAGTEDVNVTGSVAEKNVTVGGTTVVEVGFAGEQEAARPDAVEPAVPEEETEATKEPTDNAKEATKESSDYQGEKILPEGSYVYEKASDADPEIDAQMVPIDNLTVAHTSTYISYTPASLKLNCQVKYLEQDGTQDMDGKWRNVYCLDWQRRSPSGTITYTGSGTSDKICYCLMYGAQYWKQECVWPGYRSGMGWQADFYVTQMALHIVNGEFSLAWFKQVCTNSTIYNAVAKLVNAANDPSNYTGFTGALYTGNEYSVSKTHLDSWSVQTEDGVAGYGTEWVSQSYGNASYGSKNEYIQWVSDSLSGAPAGTRVIWEDKSCDSRFKIWMPAAAYEQAQNTGLNLTATINIKLPNGLGGWRYNPQLGAAYQQVTFFEAERYDAKAVNITASIQRVIKEGKLKLHKSSSNTEITNGNPCYSLEGAVYGVYQNGKEVTRLTIGADGNSSEVTLKVGNYQVKEISAPKNGSYALDTKTYNVTIGSANVTLCEVSDVPLNDPAALTISKVDEEGNKATGTSLAGTQFTINYYAGYYNSVKDLPDKATRSWVLEAKESKSGTYITGLSDTYKVAGDDLYKMSGNPVLPLGTITIQETKAANGYNLDNKVLNGKVSTTDGKILVKIEKEGDMTVMRYGDTKINEDGFTAKDTIIRTDLNFTKIDDHGKPMANIPFLIKNKATGETHVIVSDENGVVNTVAVAHSKNTNGLDQYSNGKKFTDESKLTETAGIWFGDGKVNDSRGALMYGDYYVRELACKANKGKDLIETEFSVKEDSVSVNLNPQVNHDITIKTTATDQETGTHTSSYKKETTIVDSVSYSGLKPGRTYVMKGQMVRKDTKEVLATAEKEFKPEKASGSVELPFTFDSTKLQGQKTVAFETIYWDEIELQSHADLEDEDQTISYPTIKTQATDAASGTQVGVRSKKDTIKDIVSYTGFSKGETYVVKGKLMDQNSGKAILNDGKEITSEVKFTAKKADDSVETSFTWDSTGYKGTAVVYQSVYLLKNGKEYPVIEATDISDEKESVYYPSISTSAKDGKTGDHVGTVGKTTIVDTVSYTNLKIGQEYTVSGKLMDKDTKEVFLVNGKEVTASVTFKAEKKNGTVDLVYTLDASALEGKTLVVFEDLLHKKLNVASHHDISDEEQSVHYPKIRTTATDTNTKDHVGVSTENGTIVDTVVYKNLVPGKNYTLKGTLMDKETKEAIQQNGKAVTAETSFTPSKASGTVDITFTLDTSVLEGKTIVAFEKLFHNKVEVTSHEDISDEGQSVKIPQIHTTATDSQTKDKEGVISEETKLTDVVSYKNLLPGKEYTVKGTVMVKTEDSVTAALDKDGNAVESELTFTAEKEDGDVSLDFVLDATKLTGKDVVVFEDLYYKNTKLTSHADKDDEGQTVHYPEIHTTNIDQNSGDHQGTVSKETTLVDTVAYKNLIPGHEYTVTGTLMKKVPVEKTEDSDKKEDKSEDADKADTEKEDSNKEESGKTDPGTEDVKEEISYKEEPVLIDGKPVTAFTTFTAEKADGTVDVVFTFDANRIAGETVVAFESLSYKDVELTTHTDINDESQTVYLPEIHTSTVDAETGIKNTYRDGHMTIVDTVTYKNLIPGNTYTLKGVLQEKITKKDGTVEAKAVTAKLVEADVKAEGNDNLEIVPNDSLSSEDGSVIGQTTFIPKTADGTVDVVFSFDGSELTDEEHTYVAFEELYYQKEDKEVLVRTHKDINDVEQTLTVPHIQTELLDKESGSHNVLADETVTLEDTVEYQGLIPGKKYTMTGVLMDQETGESMKVNGKEVTAETEFTPEKADGTVVVTFTFDGTGLEGKKMVAFESCLYKNKKVAVHTDLKDEKQTVYVPEIHTTATDKADGDKKLTSKGSLSVVDTITYKNLIPGKEYVVTGVLMDKATKESLKVGGKEVTATKTFTPDKANGTVDVTFTFNGNGLGDKTLVAFESISINNVPVAEHKDIDDTNQSVTLVTPPTPSKTVQTGDSNALLFALAAAGICGIAGVFVLGRRKKRS